MNIWLICEGGSRALRCTSCREANLTRGIPLHLPGSTTCCMILSTPPPLHGERVTVHQRALTSSCKSIFLGQRVTKTGPPCSFCGFKGYKVQTCYCKHSHLRQPSGARRKGLKEGPPCKGCGSTRHTPDQCCKLHPHVEPQPRKTAKPPKSNIRGVSRHNGARARSQGTQGTPA